MAVITRDNIREDGDNDIAPPRPAVLDFDVYFVLVVAALLAFGLLMVYSTTFDWSYLEFGSPVRIFLKQVRSLAVGLVGLSQFAAQYWLDSEQTVGRDEAIALLASLAWRGLAGFPLVQH